VSAIVERATTIVGLSTVSHVPLPSAIMGMIVIGNVVIDVSVVQVVSVAETNPTSWRFPRRHQKLQLQPCVPACLDDHSQTESLDHHWWCVQSVHIVDRKVL